MTLLLLKKGVSRASPFESFLLSFRQFLKKKIRFGPNKPIYYKKAYHTQHTIDRVRKGQEERKLSKSYLEAIGSPESHSFPFPFELTAWDLITRADSMGSPLSIPFSSITSSNQS